MGGFAVTALAGVACIASEVLLTSLANAGTVEESWPLWARLARALATGNIVEMRRVRLELFPFRHSERLRLR
jgi:hypothetical protein